MSTCAARRTTYDLQVHLRGSTDHLLVGDLGLGVEEEAENQLQKSSQHGARVALDS